MKNVYQIGSGELTFDIIERIINENLKLELASEARERIQKCRDYLDKKIANSDTPLYGITTGKVTKYSLYMVRPAMIRSRRNCIMVVLLLFGLLYRAMNSCL